MNSLNKVYKSYNIQISTLLFGWGGATPVHQHIQGVKCLVKDGLPSKQENDPQTLNKCILETLLLHNLTVSLAQSYQLLFSSPHDTQGYQWMINNNRISSWLKKSEKRVTHILFLSYTLDILYCCQRCFFLNYDCISFMRFFQEGKAVCKNFIGGADCELNRLLFKCTGLQKLVDPFELSMNSLRPYISDRAAAERQVGCFLKSILDLLAFSLYLTH